MMQLKDYLFYRVHVHYSNKGKGRIFALLLFSALDFGVIFPFCFLFSMLLGPILAFFVPFSLLFDWNSRCYPKATFVDALTTKYQHSKWNTMSYQFLEPFLFLILSINIWGGTIIAKESAKLLMKLLKQLIAIS